MDSFDFDDWKRLAETDPEAFEARRRKVIEATIAAAPREVQHRLRGLQWRVDMERSKSSNPTVTCLRVYRMMWDSVYGERGLVDALNDLLDVHNGARELRRLRRAETAEVLSFERPPLPS